MINIRIEDIIKKGEPFFVKKGEMIYQIGEQIHTFYYIQKGFVKIAMDSFDGRTTTISLIGPSEFFGYFDSLRGQREYTKYAVALTDSFLYAFPLELLEDVTIRGTIIVDSIVQELTKAEQLNLALSTMTVPERLRWLLLKLAKKKEGRMVIEMPLTHEEMANYLGCSRQKISNFMSKWQKEGGLLNKDGVFVIVDIEKLQQ